MNSEKKVKGYISTNRLEGFSDGVIAIIITVMVFDLRITRVITEDNVWSILKDVYPKFLSYLISFLMLAVMWVNHHQLFHQIKFTDRKLLWYNLHLLFWMSIMPFGTSFMGSNPHIWQSIFVYSVLLFMNMYAFTALRDYVVKFDLIHDAISRKAQKRVQYKNRVALWSYGLAAVFSYFSVYISYVLFLFVPAMYFIPERIVYNKEV